MPDPIRRRFGYGQLWPLRPACSQNRTGSYMPDPTSRIRFSSGSGQTHLVLKLAGVQKSSGPVSGRTQPARYQFPSFRLCSVFSTDVPDNIVQNKARSDLVMADCVRFWPNGSGPEASQCARIIRPASGQCFRADPDRMQIGSGMFTG